MFKIIRRCAVAAVVLALTAGAASAQIIGPPVIVRNQGPSAADLNRHGLNSYDRTVLGARSLSMGGTGLAMPGDAYSIATNPAALALMPFPELASESRYRIGAATAVSVPDGIQAVPSLPIFPISDYEPALTSSYTYDNLAYGMPLLLLGRRGGVGLGYRRMIDFRSGQEARFVVESPFGDADFGQGSTFTGGLDAITPSIALMFGPRVAVGANLNFISGKITENGNQGVATFGQVVASASYFFEQEAFGTSIDLGTQVKLADNLTLAGVIQPGYDLDFKNGQDSRQILPDPTSQEQVLIVLERELMDHSLSVPTQFGTGVAWQLFNNKVTVAADYWNRAWSNARVTRNEFDTVVLFPDSTNLSSTLSFVVPGEGLVEKDPKLQDTHHLRLGFEWMLKSSDDGGIEIPLRLGFRREPLTFANLDTTAWNDVRDDILEAAFDPEKTPVERQAGVSVLIDEVYQNGTSLLAGGEVTSSVLTAGSGIRVGAFSADFGIALTSYTVDRIFLGVFSDFTSNQNVEVVREDRSFTQFTFSSTLRF